MTSIVLRFGNTPASDAPNMGGQRLARKRDKPAADDHQRQATRALPIGKRIAAIRALQRECFSSIGRGGAYRADLHGWNLFL
jgi:hypothetical protein